MVILHSSHTSPSQSNLKEFLAVKGRTMGLLEIGFHWVILRDGHVLSCRPFTVMGTHCPRFDRKAIGVCLAGGHDEQGEPEDNFTEAQGFALKEVMRTVTDYYGDIPLKGHYEVVPGRDHQCPPLDMEKARAWLTERN